MIVSRSRRAVCICAAVVLAGCWATDVGAQSEETPTKRAQPKLQAKPQPKPKSVSTATHKLAIQVSENDKAAMNLALNNAENIIEYYKKQGRDRRHRDRHLRPGPAHAPRRYQPGEGPHRADGAGESQHHSSSRAPSHKASKARPKASPSP